MAKISQATNAYTRLKVDVLVLDVTRETAEIFGEVKSALRLRGKLSTFDSHFKEIPGLRLWEGEHFN